MSSTACAEESENPKKGRRRSWKMAVVVHYSLFIASFDESETFEPWKCVLTSLLVSRLIADSPPAPCDSPPCEQAGLSTRPGGSSSRWQSPKRPRSSRTLFPAAFNLNRTAQKTVYRTCYHTCYQTHFCLRVHNIKLDTVLKLKERLPNYPPRLCLHTLNFFLLFARLSLSPCRKHSSKIPVFASLCFWNTSPSASPSDLGSLCTDLLCQTASESCLLFLGFLGFLRGTNWSCSGLRLAVTVSSVCFFIMSQLFIHYPGYLLQK